MLAEVNWLFSTPTSIFGAILGLGLSIIICLCGCRTKEPKDEFAGVEGRVKITNPEEYQEEVNANKILPELPAEKSQNSAKRSLPDLPVDSQFSERNDGTWELNGDATSDLYATVILQDEKNKCGHKRQKSDFDARNPSTTYTKMNEDHPYDKLKKVEHPYAQLNEQEVNSKSEKFHLNKKKEKDNSGKKAENNNVKSNDDNDDDDDDNDDDDDDGGDVNNDDDDDNDGNNNQEDYGDDDNDNDNTNLECNKNFKSKLRGSIRHGNEGISSIDAATAITGHVIASDDLPYMTPPAHFSGDSQDSTKGYTSISVREPLSAIRAESDLTRSKRADSHYATLSDDSDDMYAAIDDSNQVYTSESETYARIHNDSHKSKVAPQPPSVDSLKQMTIIPISHSRQASTSSIPSTTALSSPKPEKRPANSPLPPTPNKGLSTTENSSCFGENAAKQSASPKNVEDMYAKVNKRLRNRDGDSFERGCSVESGVSESSDSLSFKFQISTTESSRSCHSHLSKSTLTDAVTSSSPPSSSSASSSSSSSSSTGQIPKDFLSSETDPRSGYEKLHASSFEFDRKSDPGYETVNRGPSSESSDPEYEKLKPKNLNDGYARVKDQPRNLETYSMTDGCESHGYASVKPLAAGVNGDDGYARVLKDGERGRSSSRVPEGRGGGEPTYERLAGEPEADDIGDPNYESVSFAQGGREDVEPPYQLLRECESGRRCEEND